MPTITWSVMPPSAEAAPAPVGYDTAKVEAWIAQNVEVLTPPLRWTRQGRNFTITL